MQEKIEIKLDRKDLEWVRQTALRRLLDMGDTARRFDLDSSQVVVLSYFEAFESYLIKNGINISMKLDENNKDARRAYESIDE